VRLAVEYATNPPIPAKRQLIRVLEEKGVRYGTADYWLAYYVDFMTDERILLAATEPQRIKSYNAIVAAHAAEAVRLSRQRCDEGILLIPGVYQCP
jgi:IS1 family transposase